MVNILYNDIILEIFIFFFVTCNYVTMIVIYVTNIYNITLYPNSKSQIRE